MEKYFITDINKINEQIDEVETLLKESMNFCEDDSIEEPEMEIDKDIDIDNELPNEGGAGIEEVDVVDSYIDRIRKFSLNGLSSLCDNPESEEYQMLKKIFQMCDKKPEKKEGLAESHRLFGILKENKKVIFETRINNSEELSKVKKILASEAVKKGLKPSDIRLVSEKKLFI